MSLIGMKSVYQVSLNFGTGNICGGGLRSHNLPYGRTGGQSGLSFSFANSGTQGVRILGTAFSNSVILSSNFATKKEEPKKKKTQKQKEKEQEKKQNDILKKKFSQVKEKEKKQALLEQKKEKAKIQKEKEKEKAQNAKRIQAEAAMKKKEKMAAAKIKKKEEDLKNKEKEKMKKEREREKSFLAKASEKKRDLIQKAKEKKAKRVKKALSAFTFYIKENHASMKKQYPNESAPEILKRLVANWKVATAEQKKSYMELAAKDKIRSETERSRIPKKATTGYALFVKERYAIEKQKGKGLTFEQIGKTLATEWRNMGVAQKQKYTQSKK